MDQGPQVRIRLRASLWLGLASRLRLRACFRHELGTSELCRPCCGSLVDGLRPLQLWLYDHVDIGVVPSVCATVGGTLPRIVLRRYARKGLRTCMRGCIRRSGAPGESIKILHGSAVSSALPGELPKFTHVFTHDCY